MSGAPAGTWTNTVPLRNFKHLKIGGHYVVVRDFTDHDGMLHPAGETWRFLGHNFVPYYDGLSLFVSLDGIGEWQVRLQWDRDAEAAIIDDLEAYIRPAAATNA